MYKKSQPLLLWCKISQKFLRSNITVHCLLWPSSKLLHSQKSTVSSSIFCPINFSMIVGFQKFHSKHLLVQSQQQNIKKNTKKIIKNTFSNKDKDGGTTLLNRNLISPWVLSWEISRILSVLMITLRIT